MIDYRAAEKVHSILIEQFGGATGIRDPRGLEAAMTFTFLQLIKLLHFSKV